MVVAVQQPQRKNHLDDIVKGLQIAQSVFGISSNIDKAEQTIADAKESNRIKVKWYSLRKS